MSKHDDDDDSVDEVEVVPRSRQPTEEQIRSERSETQRVLGFILSTALIAVAAVLMVSVTEINDLRAIRILVSVGLLGFVLYKQIDGVG